ncbi:NADP-dependent oxidoreductase [Actinoplanes bogorensis]|uniref:NADP-dependent oxidoreductase n=1 Tax=Paractinoplanes bogorensis TaxID=1610840 RepID=A0ABS5YXX4_9ACTN|nr:NADP-dependent oxidoreductase [Actinoplanes bogorensis]MBU2668176.1 NADP-dependent oxidoreductase [Actinoplanes bogorensis]
MKAVRFHSYGEPAVLIHEDVERPVAGAGQVLIRVAGTSFNGVDGNIRAGFMQGPIPVTLPHTPGIDVSGTVAEVGAGVTGIAAGDRVIGFLPMTGDGASAEYVVAPAEILAPAPTTVPLADAAALPAVGLTAWQALFEHAKLTAGQRVLINGAAGAVGGYAVQLAGSAGAHVIAKTGPGSIELTEKVDVVLNLAPIEPAELAGLLDLIGDGGVLVNTTVWMPAPSDEQRGVRGIDLYVRSDAAQLGHLAELVDAGDLRIDVAQRFPLAELPTVHAQAAAGHLHGKTVITI